MTNTYTLTDGINVIYRKHTSCCSNQTYSIFMYGTSGEIQLAAYREREPVPGFDYQVNNGWTAFTRLGTGEQLQIWLRSPQGVTSQETFFGTSSRINTLNPAGEYTFIHENRLYLSGHDKNAIDVASAHGNSFWLDGEWYVVIGRTLFKIIQ